MNIRKYTVLQFIFNAEVPNFTAMDSKNYKVLGVMSGTSRDGIDLACVKLYLRNGKWHYKFEEAATLPYTAAWEQRLGEADKLTEEDVQTLNRDYTELLAQKIRVFITEKQIENLDAVCAHGHTVFHKPELGYTLQIGNLPQLADLLGQTVVCDFRVEDVQLGGQGAPLVPIGDRLLFGDYAACINLGGFANIYHEIDGERTAYDICPVNIVLNRYAKKLGFAFDDSGKIARSGIVHFVLLEKLNALSYYGQLPPKSLGIEWVRKNVLPLLEESGNTPEDILATFTRHAIDQIVYSLEKTGNGKVLITGGGAYNSFLIESVQKRTQCTIVIPEKELIEYKEALIFGLLGVLKIRADINVLRSVTGASKDHSAGFIYHPTRS